MYIGVDIGGTKIAVSFGQGSNIVRKEIFQTASFNSYKECIDEIIRIALSFPKDAKAIGISAGSPLDSRRGIILSPPNLPGWDNVEIVQLLSSALSLPTFLLNDADAGALAESKYGNGRGYENLVFCTFGTGMGAGLIINGKLWRGRNDGAGEIGHTRLSENGPSGYGKIGSTEGWASGGGIAMLGSLIAASYIQRGISVPWYGDNISTKTIIEYARQGDKAAGETIAISSRKLGEALSLIMDIINPEVIILGSLFIRAEDLFRPGMEDAIRREALSRNICPVIPAGLGESIGDTAALTIAEEGYNGNL